MKRASLLVVGGLALSSCATQAGRREALFNRAAFDLECDKAKLSATELNSAAGGYSRVFGVTGCEKKATYLVSGDGVNGYMVILNSDSAKQ